MARAFWRLHSSPSENYRLPKFDQVVVKKKKQKRQTEGRARENMSPLVCCDGGLLLNFACRTTQWRVAARGDDNLSVSGRNCLKKAMIILLLSFFGWNDDPNAHHVLISIHQTARRMFFLLYSQFDW